MSTQLLLLSPLRKAIKIKKKESWNLQGRYQFQGLPISVENKAGSYRRGQDKDGHKWKTFMHYDYGYVRNTLAKDGDAVDVYVNKKSNGMRENYHGKPGDPETIPTEAYVVHQKKIEYSGKWPNGICPDCKKHHSECTCTKYYDEDKVMLGFDSKDDAVAAYLRQYDSKRFLGPVSTYTIDEFKTALKRSFGKKLPTKKPEHEHWEGVDLDGTLAKDDGWKGIKHIGEPVKKTVEMINKKLEQGKKVKIFTARAYDPKAIPPIREWLKQNNLPLLEITNKKDPGMVNIYDDRAVQVRKNTGNLVKAINEGNDIRIVCTEDAAISLVKLLSAIQTMGNHGASRSINIEDYGRHDFDGDGSAKIDLITINGHPLKKFKKKNGELEYPLLRKFIKSYGAEMEKACGEKASGNPKFITFSDLRNKADEMYKAHGMDGETKDQYVKRALSESKRTPKNVVVKSMLGTAATAGEPGVMYSFLRENIHSREGKKAEDMKLPKDQVTVDDFDMDGESSPETDRISKKVVVKGILYKSYGNSYDTNEKYGGHVKSEYWDSVLMSPDEYKMEEARKNREETRRSREAMQDASIYPRYDMYETLEKAEDDYEIMESHTESKHDYVVRMLREASGNQVDDMLNTNQYSEMYKAFVKAHTRKGKRVGPYFTARTKKVTTVKHTKLTGLDLSGKDAKEKIKGLHKKKEHHDLHIDAANEIKAKVEAHKQSGNTTYKVGEKEHHVDKVLKDLDDHVKHHKNEITSHDNHINKIEKRHETVAKQWEEKKKVKKESKAYDKSKALIRDTLGSDKLTAGDVHKVMLAAKKKGDDSYAHMNNFLMGTRPDLKEAVNQAGIKLDAMPDEPKKADVIDEMIKDGEHEGEKFDDDLMGVLKRMNGDDKPKVEKKVVVKKKSKKEVKRDDLVDFIKHQINYDISKHIYDDFSDSKGLYVHIKDIPPNAKNAIQRLANQYPNIYKTEEGGAGAWWLSFGKEKPVIKKPEKKVVVKKTESNLFKPIVGKDKEGNEVIANYKPAVQGLKPKNKAKIGSLELERTSLDSYTLSKEKERVFLIGRKDVLAGIDYYNQNGKLPEQPKGFGSVTDIKDVRQQLKEKGQEASDKYSDWLQNNPEARKEAEKLSEQSKIISPKFRDKYLKNAKHDFDTKWSAIYADRDKPKKSTRTPKKVVVPKEKETINKNEYSSMIDNGVFREGVAKNIQNDGQKFMDALYEGDKLKLNSLLDSLISKYAKDAGRDQGGGGAGPKKVKQARRGASQLWGLAIKAKKELSEKGITPRKQYLSA